PVSQGLLDCLGEQLEDGGPAAAADDHASDSVAAGQPVQVPVFQLDHGLLRAAAQAVGLAGLTRHHGHMAAEPGWAARWDEVYAQGDTTCSWFQDAPEMSLRMLDAAGVTPDDSVIDVGGGASPLAGALLGRGFGDVTVLDISAAAMEHARR